MAGSWTFFCDWEVVHFKQNSRLRFNPGYPTVHEEWYGLEAKAYFWMEESWAVVEW